MGRKGLISVSYPKSTALRWHSRPVSWSTLITDAVIKPSHGILTSSFLDWKRQAENQASPHYQLEPGGFPTVLGDARLNAGPSSEHKRC